MQIWWGSPYGGVAQFAGLLGQGYAFCLNGALWKYSGEARRSKPRYDIHIDCIRVVCGSYVIEVHDTRVFRHPLLGKGCL